MENVWKKYSDEDINKLNEICDDYRKFLSVSKIEREVVKNAITIAETFGFVNLDKYIEERKSLVTRIWPSVLERINYRRRYRD